MRIGRTCFCVLQFVFFHVFNERNVENVEKRDRTVEFSTFSVEIPQNGRSFSHILHAYFTIRNDDTLLCGNPRYKRSPFSCENGLLLVKNRTFCRFGSNTLMLSPSALWTAGPYPPPQYHRFHQGTRNSAAHPTARLCDSGF